MIPYKPTFLEKILATLWRLVGRHPTREIQGLSLTTVLTKLYVSSMFEKGNWLHHHIIARSVPHIHIDETNLEKIAHKATQGPIVYVTIDLGQLEYNVFNHIFKEKKLPLAYFNNVLRVRRWLKLKEVRRSYNERIHYLVKYNQLPDPILSGYLKTLLKESKSAFLSLDEKDPAYLSSPSKELLKNLFEAQGESSQAIFVVPTQLIWDKRPRKEKASLFEALFGETEKPGRFRKLVLFFRHYKKRAVVKFGDPISLKEILESSTAQKELHLYQKILGSLSLEKRVLTGPPIRARAWFMERVFEDEQLAKTLYEVSKERSKPIDSVKQLARRYAREIMGDVRYSFIEFCAVVLDWFFNNFYDKIRIDPEGLKKFKKALSLGPVVLAPNHRSHTDAFFTAYLCYQHDIVVPYFAAGLNMAFWPLGTLLHECGVFFMRRSFAGNKLYKQVFQTYLKVLVKEGYLQCFFIEGGRSRTGKMRSPKLGMISMYSEILHEGGASDIQFMPMTITYDRVMEQSSYTKEIQGEKKLKEKTRDLLYLGKYFKRRYGNIYVHFDDPISWQDASREVPESDWNEKKLKLVDLVGQKICHAINRQVVVTPQPLVATALLTTPRLGISKEEVFHFFQEELHYLKWKQVKLSDTLQNNPDAAFAEAIRQFEQAKLIKVHQGLDQMFYEIPLDKRLDLDYFKNTSLHYLLSLSLWSNILLAQKTDHLSVDKLAESYAYFQRILAYEFRFSTRLPLNQHLDKLCCYLQERKAIEYHPGEIHIHREGQPILKSYRVLIRSFLESYLIAWKTFLLRPTEPNDEKNLTKAMLAHAKHQLMLGNIQYTEAVSQTTFENAIQSFKELGLFSQESHLAKKFEDSLEQLLEIS